MNIFFRKRVCEMDLSAAMEEAKLACSYFFNNRFEEARALMRP
ncbi:putative Tetratricopeptide repeat protein 39B-like 3, partial [Homarus americanus]